MVHEILVIGFHSVVSIVQNKTIKVSVHFVIFLYTCWFVQNPTFLDSKNMQLNTSIIMFSENIPTSIKMLIFRQYKYLYHFQSHKLESKNCKYIKCNRRNISIILSSWEPGQQKTCLILVYISFFIQFLEYMFCLFLF